MLIIVCVPPFEKEVQVGSPSSQEFLEEPQTNGSCVFLDPIPNHLLVAGFGTPRWIFNDIEDLDTI